MKRLIGALYICVMSSAAWAGSFTVPYEKPALTVAVPSNWNPNHSEDGVDGASPDRSIFFSISTFEADDCTKARDDALKFLTRNGMTIDRASAKESAQPLAGLQTTQTQYSAMEDGTAKQVIIVVAPITKRCLQIAQWGTQEGFQRNAIGLTKIIASIKLLGK